MGIKDVANFFHMNSKDGHPLWESMEIQNLISNQSFTNLLKKRCNILYVSLKDNGQHQLYKNPTYTPKHIRHRNGAIWIKYSLLMLLFNRNYSLFSSLFSLLIYFVKITFGFHCTNLNNVAFDESSGQEFFTWYEIMIHITQDLGNFTCYVLQLVTLGAKLWVVKVVVGTYT